jgi:crotonobetainyl-CoA:carnitine CoA-transferase CaiB-like acyl-CoA transferase
VIGKEEFIPFNFTRNRLPKSKDDKKASEIFKYLNQLFLTKNRDEWFEFLSSRDVPVGKVYSLDEAFADPQVLHRKMIMEFEHSTEGKVKQVGIAVKLSDTPGKVRSLPAIPGEHSDEILKGLGYSRQKIKRLHNEGIIG